MVIPSARVSASENTITFFMMLSNRLNLMKIFLVLKLYYDFVVWLSNVYSQTLFWPAVGLVFPRFLACPSLRLCNLLWYTGT